MPNFLAETAEEKRNRAAAIYALLSAEYPDVTTFLDHSCPFQLLIAVILSAQCTDARVNRVTPGLFAAFPTPAKLAEAAHDDVKTLIASVNYCNAKTEHIIRTSQILVATFNGQVPVEMESLLTLPGVGRKTANVVRGQAFGLPGITVDTHVKRLVNRLGFVTDRDPERIERLLSTIWDDSIWSDFSTQLIVHGRKICDARRPQCNDCLLNELCPRVV